MGVGACGIDVEMLLGPLACCIGAIEGLRWGPPLRCLDGAPCLSLLIAALCLGAELLLIVARKVERVGAIAHAASLREGTAPGGCFGRGAPIDTHEDREDVGVN